VRNLLRLSTVGAVALLALAACGDDAAPQASDTRGQADVPDSAPTFVGELTTVSAFEPITEDCIDAEDADPDGSVSSDDPPLCTSPDNTTLGTVLLEAEPGVQQGDKISLRVDADTVLLRRTAEGAEPVGFDALAAGDAVRAWVFGPVAESYPMQGYADVLVIDV
jgi:hypothetical protein